jgi:hypothetical protein
MKQEEQGPPDRPSSQVATRKRYQRPVLELYGDLTDITQSMMEMMMMMNDGASHPNKHFTA